MRGGEAKGQEEGTGEKPGLGNQGQLTLVLAVPLSSCVTYNEAFT